MKLKLIDEAKDWWRMSSNWVNMAWGAVCAVWSVTPRDEQIGVLNTFGLDGAAGAPAIQFFTSVAVAVAAAAVTARVTAQPKLQALRDSRAPDQP